MSDEESPKMEILDRYFGHSLSKDILDQSFLKKRRSIIRTQMEFIIL